MSNKVRTGVKLPCFEQEAQHEMLEILNITHAHTCSELHCTTTHRLSQLGVQLKLIFVISLACLRPLLPSLRRR
jgi:hypothetical protein